MNLYGICRVIAGNATFPSVRTAKGEFSLPLVGGIPEDGIRFVCGEVVSVLGAPAFFPKTASPAEGSFFARVNGLAAGGRAGGYVTGFDGYFDGTLLSVEETGLVIARDFAAPPSASTPASSLQEPPRTPSPLAESITQAAAPTSPAAPDGQEPTEAEVTISVVPGELAFPQSTEPSAIVGNDGKVPVVTHGTPTQPSAPLPRQDIPSPAKKPIQAKGEEKAKGSGTVPISKTAPASAPEKPATGAVRPEEIAGVTY